MAAPGGIEWLFMFVFAVLPILIVVYVVVLLRDIRSGIRGLNDRTDAIERKLDKGTVEDT